MTHTTTTHTTMTHTTTTHTTTKHSPLTPAAPARPQPLSPELELIRPLTSRDGRAVFELRHRTTQRTLALKASVGTLESPAGQAQVQELVQLHRWQHPLLPAGGQLFPQLVLPGLPEPAVAFTQEWLEGPSLTERLTERLTRQPEGLPVAEVETLAQVLLTLLCWFHASGLVHLDLKGDHVLFTQQGIRVLDLEQVALEDPLQPRRPLGTPLYASPEVLEGQAPEPRSDLYSVGRLLLQALTGRLPFPEAETLPAAAQALRAAPALSPELEAEVNARAPALAPLLRQLLAPEAQQRPESALTALTLLDPLAAASWRETLPLPPALQPRRALEHPALLATGQEASHTRLETAWTELLSTGTGQGFRFSSPPGAGHSHFLLELALRAQAQGRWVLRLEGEGSDGGGDSNKGSVSNKGCVSNKASEPDGSAEDASQALLLAVEARLEALNLPPLAGPPPGLELETRARADAQRLARQLHALGATQPLLLLVEAPDTLEVSAQALLLQLIRILPELPVLLVVHPPAPPEPTGDLRTGTAPTSSAPRLVRGLYEALGLLNPLELDPLSREQARALADAHLSRSPLSTPALDALWTHSEGQTGRFIRGLTRLWRNPTCDPSTVSLASLHAPAQDETAPSPAALEPESQLELARQALQAGRLFDARSAAQRALEGLEPPSTQTASSQTASSRTQAALILAETALQLGDPRAALTWLETPPIGTAETLTAFHWLRGRAFRAVGSYDEALKTLTPLLMPPAEGTLGIAARIRLREGILWLLLVTGDAAAAREVIRQTRPLLPILKRQTGLEGPELSIKIYEVWAELRLSKPSSPAVLPASGELTALIDRLKSLAATAMRLSCPNEELRARMLLAEVGESSALPETRTWLEEARDRARALFDLATEAATLNNLTRLLIKQGDRVEGSRVEGSRVEGSRVEGSLEAAQLALTRAQALAERLQDVTSTARVLLQRCELYRRAERPALALQVLQEAQALLGKGADPQLRPWSRLLEGQLLRAEQQNAPALLCLQDACESLLAQQHAVKAFEAGVEWLELWVETEVPLAEASRQRLEQVVRTLQALPSGVQTPSLLGRLLRAQAQAISPVEVRQALSPSGPVRVSSLDLAWLERFERVLSNLDCNQDLAQSLADLLAEVLDGRSVVLLEGAFGPVRAQTGVGLEQLEWVSKSVVHHVMRTKEPWFCPDLHASRERLGESIRGKGVRSVACVPILAGSHCLGALYLDHREVGRASAQLERAAIGQVAHLVGALLAGRDAQVAQAVEEDLPSFGLVGNSPALQKVRRELARMCRPEVSMESCTLVGPPGVGKNTSARALHDLSPRSNGPYLEINVNRGEGMMEAELFGIAPSSGLPDMPKEGKIGLLEAAQGGTLFLDEVQGFLLLLQSKLLPFFNLREITPVGSTTPRKIKDVRIIFGTSVDPRALVASGKMLRAFADRIWRRPIPIPSLKERGAGDIRLLLEHFLRQLPGFASSPAGLLERCFTREALAFLERYDWPGNVREVENLLLLGTDLTDALEQGQRVGLPLIWPLLSTPPSERPVLNLTPIDVLPPPGLTRAQLWDHYLSPLTRRYYLREAERHSSKVAAALALGVSRTTFYELLDKGDRPVISERR